VNVQCTYTYWLLSEYNFVERCFVAACWRGAGTVARAAFSYAPLLLQSRKTEFLNKTPFNVKNTHDKLVLLDCIYIDYRCSSSGSDMVKAVLYILLKINSTKSFMTTIMKLHHVLYHREEETVYNIQYRLYSELLRMLI